MQRITTTRRDAEAPNAEEAPVMPERPPMWASVVSTLGLALAAALLGTPAALAAMSSRASSVSQQASVCQIVTKAEVASATHTTVGSPTEQKNGHSYDGRVYDTCSFPAGGDPTFIQLLLFHGSQTAAGLASEASTQGGCTRVPGAGTAYFCTGNVMDTLRGTAELDVDGARSISKSALIKLATIADKSS
jgi:hypothetical protein